MLSVSFLGVSEALLIGFGISVLIFISTLVIAVPLGWVFTFGERQSHQVIRRLTKGFVWVIRGTPLMLQVIIVFYGPGLLFGPDWSFKSRVLAVIIAFAVNYACYFGEIYRGGIESIAQGQYEASQILGLSKRETFFQVILPQVYRRIIPAMGNEIITLIKDTALANIIAVGELVMVAKEIVAINGVLWPLFYTGLFYLIFNGGVSLLLRKMEKSVSYYKV